MGVERNSIRVLAGVDLGTLTCRLLIAKVGPDRALTELHSERKVLRFGEGVAGSRRLSQPAMRRVVETLGMWRRTIQAYAVEEETCVGTSALREAQNREEFLHMVKASTGFDVEVISGDEEARRTMLGIRAGLNSETEGVLGIDIGGGSTEFMLDVPRGPCAVVSVDLGVVRIHEEFLQEDPPTAEDLRHARRFIQTRVTGVKDALGDLAGVALVGTAGTVTTLAAMAQKLQVYESARIHNYSLTLTQVCEIEGQLIDRTVAQRRGLPGLEPGREEVIVAGTLILREIMEKFKFKTCLVSDFGLREGIVLTLADRLETS